MNFRFTDCGMPAKMDMKDLERRVEESKSLNRKQISRIQILRKVHNIKEIFDG